MELSDTPQKPAPGLAAPKPQSTPSDQLFPTWERALKFAWVAGVAVVAIVAYRYLKPEAAKPVTPIEHFPAASRLTSGEGLTLSPAIAPNGNLLAFASDRGGSTGFAIWTKPVDSGEPSRLTSGEFNDSDPDYSPDGRQIVFRSERDGGGVYIVPSTSAATPRLVAKGGWRPRFSPDGKWIAFFTLAGSQESTASFGVGQIFLVSPDGGEPRRLRADFPYARYPIWSPDSQRLLFSGTNAEGVKDWWATPLDNGPAMRTRVLERLGKELKVVGYPEQWTEDGVYFSGATETTTHIWIVPLAASTLELKGAPKRLTDGQNQEQQSVIGPARKMFYSVLHFSSDVWALPIDPNEAKPLGKLKPLTNDHVRAQLPGISSDGSKMVYVSDRSGVRDVWVGDTNGAGGQAVTSFRQIGYRPVLSPDGRRVVYPALISGKCAVLIEDLGGRHATASLEGCYSVWDWSPDGSSLLTFETGKPTAIDVRNFTTGVRRVALSHPTQGLFSARFSPDGRWIAFTSGLSSPQARVYIAPFRGQAPSESEWILVSDHPSGGEPAWSPDGNVLYFHSKQDGFHCIWAQKLNAAKKPEGGPIAIQHLHSSAFGMYFLKSAEFGMAVTKDQLIFNLAKGEGDIWSTTVEKN